VELLYVIYTYNRPRVLQECIRSLFTNNDLKPDRVVFIDDGSHKTLKTSLFQQVMSTDALLDMISFKQNIGYGRAAEIGFAVADMFAPRYCFFIESDYIFRKHGLDEVYDVLQSDIGRNLAGVAGYSHPDFFNADCIGTRYPQEMAALYGRDTLNRQLLFKPSPFQSRFGPIQLQYVSNSCGTMYLNWRLISQMRATFYPRMETDWIQRTCNKGASAPLLHDGIMSCGLSHFWMEYAKMQGWDTTKEAALIDIIPSVANHLCAGGINAADAALQEGQTFVGSPSFPKNYNVY
jgi:hypothetical protein